MNIDQSTILITGGGSGIGRGLAEGLHRLGARVIVAGRRREALEEVAASNPGVTTAVLDVEDAASLPDFAATIARAHPALNVLINNAGVARFEDLTAEKIDLADAETMVATNVLGPIRLTAALLPHLRAQPEATVINVSSGLAFVPLAASPTYCATKAAMHAYTQSLRQQLKATSVEVIEIIPPYVQTELGGPQQAVDERAMPLDAFIAETLALLQLRPTPQENTVEAVGFLRRAEAEGRFEAAFEAVNSMF